MKKAPSFSMMENNLYERELQVKVEEDKLFGC